MVAYPDIIGIEKAVPPGLCNRVEHFVRITKFSLMLIQEEGGKRLLHANEIQPQSNILQNLWQWIQNIKPISRSNHHVPCATLHWTVGTCHLFCLWRSADALFPLHQLKKSVFLCISWFFWTIPLPHVTYPPFQPTLSLCFQPTLSLNFLHIQPTLSLHFQSIFSLHFQPIFSLHFQPTSSPFSVYYY